MVKSTVSEETWRHEEGWQTARLESVVEERVKFIYKEHHAAVREGNAKAGDEGGFTKWRWNFTLTSSAYQGDRIRVDTDPRITTQDGDLARIFYEAFKGRALELGEEIDTDLIEGRQAEVLIAHDMATFDRTGKKFSTISDARSLGEGSQPADGFNSTTEEPPF